MKQSQHDALWTCQTCGTKKVIPGLARDCEARHEHPLDSQEMLIPLRSGVGVAKAAGVEAPG